MAALGRTPLLYERGRMWLYDTSATIQGILISRIAGAPLDDVLTERIEPLGMVDAALQIPAWPCISVCRSAPGGAR
jgi:CubicO group peptidase (beta-lactamase class C family)